MGKGLLKRMFLTLIRKNSNSISEKIEHYVFYRIVDLKEEKYILQCINKNALFEATITEIIFDRNILYGLHPIQACYIGMEYAKHLKNTDACEKLKNKQHTKFQKDFLCRYGSYSLRYQNRKGDIGFINKKTLEEFIMDPTEIVASEALVQEFDASQAFYLGLFAELKTPLDTIPHFKKPYLCIVK